MRGRKTKILQIINSMGYGGAEARVIDELKALERSKYSVSLTTLKDDAGFRNLIPADVQTTTLPVSKSFDLPKGILRLYLKLSKMRPDILHSHLVQASIVGRIAGRMARIPIVLSTQHNAYNPKEDSVLYRLECSTRRLCDGIIALSEAIREYLECHGYQGRIHVIPTGVDGKKGGENTSRRAPVCNGPYIVSVGHCRDSQKGHDILIRAFGYIRAMYPGVRLLIVGDGKQRRELVEIASKLGLSNDVMFLGKREDVQECIQGAEVFVLASRWEGFGRVLIEAMALGRPIVASRTEAIPEVVEDEKTGILVPPGDVECLAKAIGRLLDRKSTAERMGTRGREVVETGFSATLMVKEIESVYEYYLKRYS